MFKAAVTKPLSATWRKPQSIVPYKHDWQPGTERGGSTYRNSRESILKSGACFHRWTR